MTETAPESPDAPPAPAPPVLGPPPQPPGFFRRAEQTAVRILPHAETAVADEVKILLRGHSAALIRVAADIIEAQWPQSEPVAVRVLEVALGVARAGGIAL